MHYNPWQRTHQFLNTFEDGSDATHADLVAEITQLLDGAIWSSDTLGFPDPSLVQELSSYASQVWLSDVHINQMLNLLSRELEDLGGSSDCNIREVFFADKLISIFKDPNRNYLTDRTSKWIRSLGDEFSTGKFHALAGVHHVNSLHWIAYAVDRVRKEIRVADSLGGSPPATLVKALQWWAFEHTGEKFVLGKLEIGKQSDSHSCGVFAVNAVAHFALPDLHPLVSQKDVALKRLQALRDVLLVHGQESVGFSFFY
ncbi:hypothetical protein SCHPADRAFT_983778 [Schizopora paradoxa]|uniref:Ubiquitin-like protease family profile domain-containing protein n=1 Tax=Schizopora paradoxa TaxID=27342 RepID=A0A0H2R835_9AGAM|nr:hypothetical protein SCHPADRAFT_983778 [Schizopora paradoxa]